MVSERRSRHCQRQNSTAKPSSPIVLSNGIEPMQTVDNAISAIEKWQRILGPSNLLQDSPELDAHLGNTYDFSSAVRCLLRPASAAEVSQCLAVANEYKLAVYPFSRGYNWGLGSKLAPQDVTALLDLSRMDRIVDYSEQHAYVTVEPGVAVQQRYEFLSVKDSNLMLWVTGGPPGGSRIGNALERGDGIGPYGDRLATICNLEVVMPEGEIVRTDFGQFDSSSISHLHNYGLGPSLNGLFTQSSFAVVTRMTVWLMPRPRNLTSVVFRVAERESLAGLIDALSMAVLEGVLGKNSAVIWNIYKTLAGIGRYPWNLMSGETPIDLDRLGKAAPWKGTLGIYAPTEDIANAKLAYLKSLCGDYIDAVSIGSDIEATGAWGGVPTDENVKSVYWRKKQNPSGNMDPHRDNCGLIWLSPLVPADGELVVEAVSEVEKICFAHNIEPNISLNIQNGRIVQLLLGIIYDRDPESDAAAMACHDEVMSWCNERGYLPSRLGAHSMAHARAGSSLSPIVEQLKRSIDPNGILSPGRY